MPTRPPPTSKTLNELACVESVFLKFERRFKFLLVYHIIVKIASVMCMADLKGCPFGQDIKNDCETCDYGDTNHFDAASGKCVKR